MLQVEYSNHVIASRNNSPFYRKNSEISINNNKLFFGLNDRSKFKLIEKFPWTHINFEENINDKRTCAWKIHISGTIENYAKIFEIVFKYCLELKINFKCGSDEESFRYLNGKNIQRATSGKFITVYPREGNEITTLEELNELTKAFDGPHILSDKRYKESSVVYYRFGEYNPIRKLTETGIIQTYVKSNSGKLVLDKRFPYYQLQDGIEELFFEEKIENRSSFLRKYRVNQALSFSATGGVYEIQEIETLNRYVAKEARKFTGIDNRNTYATERNINEKEVMERLEGTSVVPKFKEIIVDNGNNYLVQERIEGITLRQFVYTSNPLITLERDSLKIEAYFDQVVLIFKLLCRGLENIHENKVILNDISDANILIVNKPSYELEIKFCDFEYASDLDVVKKTDVQSLGFGSIKNNSKEGDIDKIIMLGLYMIFPINNLYELDINKKWKFITWAKDNCDIVPKVFIDEILAYGNQLIEQEKDPFKKYCKESILTICESVLETYNAQDTDCYIPSDPHIYNTNAFSVSHGIFGILFSLKITYENLMNCYPSVLTKLVKKSFEELKGNLNKLPKSLLIGVSGIINILINFELYEEAEILFMTINDSEKIENEGVFYGKSGLVVSYLHYWKKTDNQRAKKTSVTIANELLTSRHHKNIDLYEGDSGIALALLVMFVQTGEKKYLNKANYFLDGVIDKLYYNKQGNIAMHRESFDNRKIIESPFLYNGLSGVGFTLIYFYRVTKKESLFKLLQEIAESLKYRIHYFPGLMRGMSGITDFLITFTSLIEEKGEIKRTVSSQVMNLKLYEIEYSENRKGFTGEQLLKVSHDYYTGTTGILNVISRFLKLKNLESSKSTELYLRMVEELIFDVK